MNNKDYIFDKDDNQDLQSRLSTVVLLIVLAVNIAVIFTVITNIVWG